MFTHVYASFHVHTDSESDSEDSSVLGAERRDSEDLYEIMGDSNDGGHIDPTEKKKSQRGIKNWARPWAKAVKGVKGKCKSAVVKAV